MEWTRKIQWDGEDCHYHCWEEFIWLRWMFYLEYYFYVHIFIENGNREWIGMIKWAKKFGYNRKLDQWKNVEEIVAIYIDLKS